MAPDRSHSFPTVDVVIPVYNGAGFIRRAVESALAQTIPVAQVIVVDDGSDDSPEDALHGLPVRIIRRPNGGPAAARSTGARASEADFVAMLDADDWYHPEYLAACLDLAARSGASVVATDALMCRDGELGADTLFGGLDFPLERQEQRREVLRRNIVPGNAVFCRQVLDATGYWNESRRLAGAEDYELVLRLVMAGELIGFVDRPLYTRLLHGAQFSNDRVRALRAQMEVWETFQDGCTDPTLLRLAAHTIRDAQRALHAHRSSTALATAQHSNAAFRGTALWWALRPHQHSKRRIALLAVTVLPTAVARRVLHRLAATVTTPDRTA